MGEKTFLKELTNVHSELISVSLKDCKDDEF